MKLSLISESIKHDEVFISLLHELHGQVSDSLIVLLKKFHSERSTKPYHTQQATNQEIYQQLLNGERLLGVLEPHLDKENNKYPPNGVSDCGIELFQSEDGNKYLVGEVAAKGYEQLWKDVNVLPRGYQKNILLGLLLGYDPIEVQKHTTTQ